MHVSLTTPRQTVIQGELWAPKRPTTRLLVICHGFQSSREHPALQEISKQLHQKGHAVLTFNFSGDASGFDISQQVQDIQALTNHFGVQFSDFYLLAGSFGALSGVIATLNNPRIKGLVTVNGFFGFGSLKWELRRIFIAFRLLAALVPRYRHIWRYYRRSFTPSRISVPVLVIHAQHDKSVAISQSQRFFAALTVHKKFVTLERSDHELTVGNEIDLIVAQIDRWLTASKK